MGFRYRKSINLGGGFRINLSKSGIGQSWGVKGYRVTKTAKGTARTTASIPGTGISYVHETGKANNRSSQRNTNPGQQPVPAIDNNHYDTQNIVNSVATEMVSEGLEAMLASASRASEQAKEIIKVASPILDTTLSESDIQDVITYLDENQEANGYYYGDIGLLLLLGQQLPARLDRSLRYI